jgi:hypothetical protein
MAVGLAAWFCCSTAFSYEVWMGLHCTPRYAAVLTDTWSNVAASVEGVNYNLAPCKPTAGTGVLDADYNSVTNHIPTLEKTARPIRLRIE